jgi:hypothetical protein
MFLPNVKTPEQVSRSGFLFSRPEKFRGGAKVP